MTVPSAAELEETIQLIDNTLLQPNCTEEDISRLCKDSGNIQVDGKAYPIASICIYPEFIAHARKHNPHLKVATVVNFPCGTKSVEEVLKEVSFCISQKADEIDLLIDYSLILQDAEKGMKKLHQMIKEVSALCLKENKILKVIMETGMLEDDSLIQKVSDAVLQYPVHFLKTSSGKQKKNATLSAVKIMLERIQFHEKAVQTKDESQGKEKENGEANHVGVKVSGGIRTWEDWSAYRALISSFGLPLTKTRVRIGTSSLLSNLLLEIPRAGHKTERDENKQFLKETDKEERNGEKVSSSCCHY